MKNIMIICISTFICMSCNQPNSKEDKTSDMEIPLSKLDALTALTEESESKLLFKGYGSEPGWLIDIYNNKLRLVTDYGKDSLWLEDSFEDIKNKKEFSYIKTTSVNGEEITILVSIKDTPCISSSNGNKKDRSVLVKFKNKEYKGCGSFIK